MVNASANNMVVIKRTCLVSAVLVNVAVGRKNRGNKLCSVRSIFWMKEERNPENLFLMNIFLIKQIVA